MKTVYGITFFNWHYLYWLLPLAVGIAVVWLWRYRQQITIAGSLSAGRSILQNYSSTRSLLKTVLWLLGVFFLLLALLRPQWTHKQEMVAQYGRDLLIALDVSRSMLAQDIAPNRLSAAKQKIKRLTQLLESERIGLMLFAGDPFVQCPLTADYQAFHMFLDQIDAQTISSGTTALDHAIKKAIDVYEAMPTKKHKLLIVFTDGEDFSSDLAVIKQRAQQAGLTIFTIGVGTQQGAPVPKLDAIGNQIGHEIDAAGTVVMSRLNQGILSTLATDLGGVYIPLSSDDSDMKQLVAWVQKFEKEMFDDATTTGLEDRYPFFVAASFFCFLFEWLL